MPAMQFYLIREGDNDPARSSDPYTIPLTPEGVATMRGIARCAQGWGLQMLVTSTARAALDSADLLEEPGHVQVRWDLTELEDLVLDDLNYDPRATHLVSTWTPEQMEAGLISLWTRLVPAYARILLYAHTYDLSRLAIVAPARVLNLLLANWMGLDWRMQRQVQIDFDGCPVCRVILDEGAPTQIAWLPCLKEEA